MARNRSCQTGSPNLMSRQMFFAQSDSCGARTHALRPKASWQAIPEGSFSFTGEVKQQGAPVLLIPANQSCCPCPCFPDRGIWPGGATASTPDFESGNRGSNPRRAFAETRFVKGGKAFRVCCCLWQKVRAARQAVGSPLSSVAQEAAKLSCSTWQSVWP